MIDYEKMVHELANEYRRLDKIKEKLNELTQPENTKQKYKVGDEVWMRDGNKIFAAKIEGYDESDDTYEYVGSYDFYGRDYKIASYCRINELFPTKQALIEGQIEYWSSLKSEEKSTQDECMSKVSTKCIEHVPFGAVIKDGSHLKCSICSCMMTEKEWIDYWDSLRERPEIQPAPCVGNIPIDKIQRAVDSSHVIEKFSSPHLQDIVDCQKKINSIVNEMIPEFFNKSECKQEFSNNPPIGTLVDIKQVNERELIFFCVCDGRELNKNDYPELFKLMKFIYGKGKDDNHFLTPKIDGVMIKALEHKHCAHESDGMIHMDKNSFEFAKNTCGKLKCKKCGEFYR